MSAEIDRDKIVIELRESFHNIISENAEIINEVYKDPSWVYTLAAQKSRDPEYVKDIEKYVKSVNAAQLKQLFNQLRDHHIKLINALGTNADLPDITTGKKLSSFMGSELEFEICNLNDYIRNEIKSIDIKIKEFDNQKTKIHTKQTSITKQIFNAISWPFLKINHALAKTFRNTWNFIFGNKKKDNAPNKIASIPNEQKEPTQKELANNQYYPKAMSRENEEQNATKIQSVVRRHLVRKASEVPFTNPRDERNKKFQAEIEQELANDPEYQKAINRGDYQNTRSYHSITAENLARHKTATMENKRNVKYDSDKLSETSSVSSDSSIGDEVPFTNPRDERNKNLQAEVAKELANDPEYQKAINRGDYQNTGSYHSITAENLARHKTATIEKKNNKYDPDKFSETSSVSSDSSIGEEGEHQKATKIQSVVRRHLVKSNKHHSR